MEQKKIKVRLSDTARSDFKLRGIPTIYKNKYTDLSLEQLNQLLKTKIAPFLVIDSNVLTKPIDQELASKYRLREVILFFTEECNSMCTTCSLWKIPFPQKLDNSIIEKFFSHESNQFIDTVFITGGEPFMTDQCIDIAKILKEHNPYAKITGATNCLDYGGYTNRILSIKNNIGVDVVPSISLNGTEETHDKTRGIIGNYRYCIRFAERCKSNGIKFDFTFVETPITKEHDFKHVQELADKFNTTVGWSESIVTNRFGFKTEQQEKKYNNFNCVALEHICCVYPNGDVRACEDSREELTIGNLYRESMDKIYESIIEKRKYIEENRCQPCKMFCFYNKRKET